MYKDGEATRILQCGLLYHTMGSTNIDTKRTKQPLCIYLPCELFTFFHSFQSLLKACRAQEAQVPTRILVYHFHLSTHFHKQLTTPRNETRSSFSALKSLEWFQEFLHLPKLV